MERLDEWLETAENRWGAAIRWGSSSEVGARWVLTEGDALVVETAAGVFPVHGAIGALYQRLGGPSCGLGLPTSTELVISGGAGRVTRFEEGHIFWTDITGAHELHGEIARLALVDGEPRAELGYPITDELSTPDGRFYYQYFERGSLTYDTQSGVARFGSPRERIFGWADTHVHPATHLAFGGALIHGEPVGDPRDALRACDLTHGPGGLGWAPMTVIVQSELEQRIGHRTHGWGTDGHFDGWPHWRTLTHQSAHISWMRRCYDHGQRLMVALVANSEVLAYAVADGPKRSNFDDFQVEAQIKYVKEVLEAEADWMTVVYDPVQARQVIADENRMAVILGVELDDLLKLDRSDGSVFDRTTAVVGDLHDKGVRYAFPIHLADNQFGDMALYVPFFHTNSAFVGRGLSVPTTRSAEVDYGRDGTGRGEVNDGPGLTGLGRHLLNEMALRGWLIDIDHMSWKTAAGAVEWAREARDRLGYPLVSGHATINSVVIPGDKDRGRNESRKTPQLLRDIASLGGFVGVQTIAVTTQGPTGHIPHAHGTSHGFAQGLLAAQQELGDRVVLGSDINGLAPLLGPRFGPAGAPYGRTSEQRRAQVRAQRRGVRYDGPMAYLDADRFHSGDAITPDERDALRVAIAAESEAVAAEPLGPRLMKSWRGIHQARTDPAAPPPGDEWERAGWVAATDTDPQSANLSDEHKRWAGLLRDALIQRAQTVGFNNPLPRCRTGRRDWDYNYDGLAHYGLLPDLIIDTANLGLGLDRELLPLLKGAETVLSTWEFAQPAATVKPPLTHPVDQGTLTTAELPFDGQPIHRLNDRSRRALHQENRLRP